MRLSAAIYTMCTREEKKQLPLSFLVKSIGFKKLKDQLRMMFVIKRKGKLPKLDKLRKWWPRVLFYFIFRYSFIFQSFKWLFWPHYGKYSGPFPCRKHTFLIWWATYTTEVFQFVSCRKRDLWTNANWCSMIKFTSGESHVKYDFLIVIKLE